MGRTYSEMLPSVFKLLNIPKGKGFLCFLLVKFKRITLKKREGQNNEATDSLALAEINSLVLLQSLCQATTTCP